MVMMMMHGVETSLQWVVMVQPSIMFASIIVEMIEVSFMATSLRLYYTRNSALYVVENYAASRTLFNGP
jgi:hypothetical protein